MKNITVKEIIEGWLINNGYNGLACEGCGCGLKDLFPCNDGGSDCEPAHEKICKCGDYFYTTEILQTNCFECTERVE